MFILLLVVLIILATLSAVLIKSSELRGFIVYVSIAGIIFTMLLITAGEVKDTSISHIEGKPLYEKRYVVDQAGNTVDSIYVKLNTQSK